MKDNLNRPIHIRQFRFPYLIWIIVFGLGLAAQGCSRSNNRHHSGIDWFPELGYLEPQPERGFYFIPDLKAYQQTTEYTCGPAALMALSRYYGVPEIRYDTATEMRIAAEAGTRNLNIAPEQGKPGTKPDEMKRWLQQKGLEVELIYESQGDGSALDRLRDNTRRRIPTLIEWADLTGHWAIVVGYDTRGNQNPWDDVIILADSYDRYDDYTDGYSFMNANRFYWLWFDAFYFDTLTWRTMITVQPHSQSEER